MGDRAREALAADLVVDVLAPNGFDANSPGLSFSSECAVREPPIDCASTPPGDADPPPPRITIVVAAMAATAKATRS